MVDEKNTLFSNFMATFHLSSLFWSMKIVFWSMITANCCFLQGWQYHVMLTVYLDGTATIEENKNSIFNTFACH